MKKRICTLDSDVQRSIVFQRKIEVWLNTELECVGLIEGFSDDSVRVDGGYYLRENCEFVMI
jgi:hypothetical protein